MVNDKERFLYNENNINVKVNCKMLFDLSNAPVEELEDELFLQKEVSLSVLRLDTLHPVVSGNKLFKLHYFLTAAISAGHSPLVTFGGAYSNHLVATAFACREAGVPCTGIIRGEQPEQLSHTLQHCISYGMDLNFVSRATYDKKEDESYLRSLKKLYGACIIIPEGGYHPLGATGASKIMELYDTAGFSHICTAVGTATTLAGLLIGCREGQQIIGIPVLKGLKDIGERILYLLGYHATVKQPEIQDQYHFGGYAKKTEGLLHFMNDCMERFRLPLDFVYTAKLFYGIMDGIRNDHYPPGSRILCLHTGGLQGNDSLPEGSLNYH